MIALIAEANFTADNAGTPQYVGRVHFNVGTTQYVVSNITVNLQAGDTLNTLKAKFLAAIDAEAGRLGTPAPTAVYGGSVDKFR